MEAESRARDLYRDANVLVTGGTGFLGKVLVEKLLRSTDVAKVYLVIRSKRGVGVESRLDQLFRDVVFARLGREVPGYRSRVEGVLGDCSQPDLGLQDDNKRKLQEEVNIVFHSAATVRFDEELKVAFETNVSATKYLLDLCCNMKNLKSVMYVSTAYSNCNRKEIDEVFYEPPMTYEDVDRILQTNANTSNLNILGEWPNTYTFTKAISEDLVRRKGGQIPVGVFRPAIVTSTYREPLPGWIDNLNGPNGSCAATLIGTLRSQLVDRDVSANIVPADTCVAALLVAAWDTHRNRRLKRVPVYNCVSSSENRLTWGEYIALCFINSRRYPSSKAVWNVWMATTDKVAVYKVYNLFYHWVPAIVVDGFAMLSFKRPRMVPLYFKLHRYVEAIGYFSLREWRFENGNVQRVWNELDRADRELFPMSVASVNWIKYFDSYLAGVRRFLLKDSSEIDEGKVKQKRFAAVEFGLILGVVLLSFYVLFSLKLCQN